MAIVKHFVSKKKRRFQQDGFDLDLTYIEPNIVAMGFPSDKFEGMFRNKADDVIRFFKHYHGDSYKVYNLCSERKYDPSKFHNRVAEYPFEDHNAPRFEMLKPCCEDIDDWLKGERNVAAIHCKAGKGRTGVVICSYLLHIGKFSKTKEALQFYGESRTQNAKGVTIPSQRRYVYYYNYMLKLSSQKIYYAPTTLLLKSITLVGVPAISGGICAPLFIVRQGQGAKIFQSETTQDVKKTDREIKITLPKPFPICGDMRIEFLHVGKLNKKEKMFQYWFNTFFIYHACPTEEQEELKEHTGVSVPHCIPEHSNKEGSKSSKRAPPPHGANAERAPPPHGANAGDSAASLPIQKSTSSNSLGDGIEMRCSPERQVGVGVGLTRKKRASVRRSFSDIQGEGIPPDFCEEFNLNLPKWELDRAHKDKECKFYPESFRVITTMANPMSQDSEDIDIDSDNKRNELVELNSDLSEDSDDDDVGDPSEIVKRQTDRKEHKRKHNPKHAKSSSSQIGHFSKICENEAPVTRTHSNAITSLSPTVITQPIFNKFEPQTDQNQPLANPKQASVNPSQASVNQNQSSANANQSSVNQNQSSVNQNQSSVNQNQSSVNQNQSSANANQSSVNQNQSSVNQNQSSVNQNQSSVDTNQSSVNPNQASVNPNQASVNPNQASVNPNQSSVNSNQASGNVNLSSVNPSQASVIPNQSSVNSNQSSVNSNQASGNVNLSSVNPNQSSGNAKQSSDNPSQASVNPRPIEESKSLSSPPNHQTNYSNQSPNAPRRTPSSTPPPAKDKEVSL